MEIADILTQAINYTIHINLHNPLKSKEFREKNLDYANTTLIHLSKDLLSKGRPNTIITADHQLKALAHNSGLNTYTTIELSQYPQILHELLTLSRRTIRHS